MKWLNNRLLLLSEDDFVYGGTLFPLEKVNIDLFGPTTKKAFLLAQRVIFVDSVGKIKLLKDVDKKFVFPININTFF